MNVQKLIAKMSDIGINLQVDKAGLRVKSKQPLNDEQRQYLKQHKTEILSYLANQEAANQSKRYAYRFTLKDNRGGGTYITDCPPAQAKQELLAQFVGREVATIDLLN